MIQYLKQYASTHIFYLILIGVALVAFHSWQQEHDARLLADQQIASSDAAVKASAQQIGVLEKQITGNDAKSARDLASLEKTIAAVKTPQQAAADLPQVAANLPAPVTVQPDSSISFPKEDVLPLFQDLADGKVCAVKLAQCQADYATEQQIASQKDSQLTEKNKEITALKKPKGFWKRVTGTLKQVGIGIGIGAVLGAKL
jgi:hypothetical protein